MAKPLKPFVRGGGYYPSSRWTPLVYPGGYTTANGAMSPINTVKGAIAHVTDALAIPAIGLKCEINPLQAGTGDPSPDNVRPIIGWTGCNVTRTGKNLLSDDPSNYISGYIDASGNEVLSTGSLYTFSNGYIPVNPSEKYTVSAEMTQEGTSNYAISIAFYKADKSFIERPIAWGPSHITGRRISGTVTSPADAKYCRVNVWKSRVGKDFQLERGAVMTDYEPYQGDTYNITFPTEAGTVYGGTLDVVNGTLMATEANIANYDGETLPGEWVSDRDVYSAGATPTTGAQVVYKLSNPIAYQLTPQQIELLAGVNNIWHDANGDTELTYYAE